MRVHALLLDRADIVEVDIDQEPVEIGMDVERRAAFQSDPWPDRLVGAEGVENVEAGSRAPAAAGWSSARC